MAFAVILLSTTISSTIPCTWYLDNKPHSISISISPTSNSISLTLFFFSGPTFSFRPSYVFQSSFILETLSSGSVCSAVIHSGLCFYMIYLLLQCKRACMCLSRLSFLPGLQYVHFVVKALPVAIRLFIATHSLHTSLKSLTLFSKTISLVHDVLGWIF